MGYYVYHPQNNYVFWWKPSYFWNVNYGWLRSITGYGRLWVENSIFGFGVNLNHSGDEKINMVVHMKAKQQHVRILGFHQS